MARGGLFADDLVTFAPDLESTVECCAMVRQWTECNKMKVGITKCGILGVCLDEQDVTLTEDHPLQEALRIMCPYC